MAEEQPLDHGHFFTKKSFHKPTYCHHCTDLLWGFIGQGLICRGRCMNTGVNHLYYLSYICLWGVCNIMCGICRIQMYRYYQRMQISVDGHMWMPRFVLGVKWPSAWQWPIQPSIAYNRDQGLCTVTTWWRQRCHGYLLMHSEFTHSDW